MKYEQVWDAVDKLAKRNGLSPSGLAKKAGLDSTTFNKSKRIRPDGNKRWPSLDSINKIIDVCNMSFEDFYNLGKNNEEAEFQGSIPYIKYSKLGNSEIADTTTWGKIRFPDSADNLFAIDVDVGGFEPFYRRGSIIVVSRNSEIRRGDRVVILLNNGDVLINEFVKRTAKTIELIGIINEDVEQTVEIKDIKIINRIVWASQ